MEINFCIRALDKALSIAIPKIFNSDQGSQFTSVAFLECLEKRSIQISRDGRGRAMDNVFTDRLPRSVKYEEVYLHDYGTVSEAKQGIGNYINFYNQERPHQSLNYKTPAEMYFDSNNQEKKLDCILNMANSCLDNGVHLIKLFTITWTTLSELATSIHNTMNNIFISFRKLTSKEKIFKGAIKTISGVLSKIKVAHYQVQIGGSVKVLIDKRRCSAIVPSSLTILTLST